LDPPNQTLQQTAAAILVFPSSLSHGAAAAAELGRSAEKKMRLMWGNWCSKAQVVVL
jgi:hypothetical protein